MNAKFFTVADPDTGLGHLFRCDALAEALARKNINVQLMVHCTAGGSWLADKPLYSPWKVLNWLDKPEFVACEFADCDIPVFDAYNISANVWEFLRNSGKDCVLFDDYGEKPYIKGLLINGSPGADIIPYPDFQDRRLFLGPDYQVLRPPFWEHNKRIVRKNISSVGVILGGTDHLNLLPKVIEFLSDILLKRVQIYIFGSKTIFQQNSNLYNSGYINAKEMKIMFDSLDFLVSAAGQTMAEAVATRLPSLMIKTAINQTLNFEGWATTYSAAIPYDLTVENFNTDKFKEIFLSASKLEIRKNLVKACEKINLNRSTQNIVNAIGEYYERTIIR